MTNRATLHAHDEIRRVRHRKNRTRFYFLRRRMGAWSHGAISHFCYVVMSHEESHRVSTPTVSEYEAIYFVTLSTISFDFHINLCFLILNKPVTFGIKTTNIRTGDI